MIEGAVVGDRQTGREDIAVEVDIAGRHGQGSAGGGAVE